MHSRPRRKAAALLTAAATFAGVGLAAAAPAQATTGDTFYTYSGSTPLSSIKPGTILKTRTLSYHLIGIPTPLKVVQMLYRTTDAQGRASANVTSVIKPATGVDPTKAVSYESFYDSLNPADSPSRSIAGNVTFGGVINDAEALFIVPLLAQGYSVIVPDTEGQEADFAAGPEYGTNSLDSIRAATHSPATGLNTSTRIGLLGYSGGAIGADWTAQLAPKYAPDVNKQLVGAAIGGVLVDPAHNLKYVGGSTGWAGVAPMAIIGVGRAYGIDFTPYLNDRGKDLMAKLHDASIANVLFNYPGLTWQDLVKPAYDNPNSIPAYVKVVNKLNMGSAATPTTPMFIGQGAGGYWEGTAGNKPGIGAGDGVMIAGDVRTLARQYCATGNTSIKYTQYNLTSHIPTAALWAPSALAWLDGRFAGKAAPSSCGHIAQGNPLTPEHVE